MLFWRTRKVLFMTMKWSFVNTCSCFIKYNSKSLFPEPQCSHILRFKVSKTLTQHLLATEETGNILSEMEICISEVRILHDLCLSNPIPRNLSKDYNQECVERYSNNDIYLHQKHGYNNKKFLEKLKVQQSHK